MTQSQKRALDAVQNMIKAKTDEVFARDIMILIFGILNVEHDMYKDTTISINPNDVTGNDNLQINIPNIPGVQIGFPGEITHPEPCPFPPQVWYEQETEPRQPTAQELRYATEVSCTGDKNGIVYTTNTADVQYNGDFRDEQTSFNDK